MDRMRILICDSHEMVCAGIASVLAGRGDTEVVGQASDGLQALELLAAHRPGLVLTDVMLPRLNGIELAQRVGAAGGRTIFLSSQGDPAVVREAFRAGASGYLLKSSAAAELIIAIQAARRGGIYLSPPLGRALIGACLSRRRDDSPSQGQADEASAFQRLTPRQRAVLQLLAEGLTNKEAGACLCVSAKTIETHRAQLMQALGIHSVAGLTKYAVRQGLTSVEARSRRS